MKPKLIKQVDFIVGGTQKGGTSALDAYLRRHPEIVMANQKGNSLKRGIINVEIFLRKEGEKYRPGA